MYYKCASLVAKLIRCFESYSIRNGHTGDTTPSINRKEESALNFNSHEWLNVVDEIRRGLDGAHRYSQQRRGKERDYSIDRMLSEAACCVYYDISFPISEVEE